MTKVSAARVSDPNGISFSGSDGRTKSLGYFVFAVLGFSFWFFMVVPFASHRESYWWLAMVHTQRFAHAFGFISSTYRPLAQGATWSAFTLLNPSIFPTSIPRQALLQMFIYAMFVLAWWLIYSSTRQWRAFALIAFVIGGVFFSGYVQLFHLYGLFYVPVILTLGGLLCLNAANVVDRREAWFAATATVLAFWHPFATGLFVGFYFGFYLDTFWRRSKLQHIQALLILLVGTMAMAATVVLFPRAAAPIGTRLLGFLVSYKTNEVNLVASLVAFLLAQTAIVSMEVTSRIRIGMMVVTSALGVVFFVKGLPILFLWILVALIKLFRMRCWGLFFLTLTAALLPFGGGLGSPMYVLFAIILAAYATSLGWTRGEKALLFFKTRYVMGIAIALAMVVLLIRFGFNVPAVTRAANPLLSERERTYQLESILARLHDSEYCGRRITFAEDAGNPVDSVESAITRRYRPPSALEDVNQYWNKVLRCQKSDEAESRPDDALVITFGGQTLPDSRPVVEIPGRYAGDARVWIPNSRK